jgi:hypothetical protein
MKNLIELWMKYAWNYKCVHHEFKYRKEQYCYAPELVVHLGDHFVEKWSNKESQKNMNGTWALLWLWHELDNENQQEVVEWLKENYKG